MDGSSNNRSFLKMHFMDDMNSANPRKEQFTKTSLYGYNQKVSFIMDPSHLFKKIRNNILKSGSRQYDKRLLQCKGKYICWEYWIGAYQWDRNKNTCRIHYKLTDAHLFPDTQQKMRNKLAEEVLNEDMLTLFKAYQNDLHDGSHLDATVELLQHTSKLIKTFRDRRPIMSMDDIRLKDNEDALQWFLNWDNSILHDDTQDSQSRKRSLMSVETRDDLVSLVMGSMNCVRTNSLRMGKYCASQVEY
ncbi:uncharacterized protein [Ptychodera flava]|uniref:uncharacterized protein n=1 Tax=Ptychodera flava TaxID=63121 RepID=UPI00396A4C72